jgi:hypothetical protein
MEAECDKCGANENCSRRNLTIINFLKVMSKCSTSRHE